MRDRDIEFPFDVPYDLAAETAVIGSLFLDPELSGKLTAILSDDDFYGEANREVWRAELECINDGILDIITLEAKLRQRGTLDKIGNLRFVLNAVNATPTSEGAEVYAKQVEECGRRRRLLRGLSEACSALSDGGASVADISDYVQQTLLIPNTKRKTSYSFGEAFDAFEKDYADRKMRGVTIPGVSTGFSVLDHALGGLERGKMYVLGARPGMGKTAFALKIAYSLARYGRKTMLFSLEMGHKEVVKRLVSIAGRISSSAIKQCLLDDKELEEAKKVRKSLENNLIVNDDGYQTMQKITSECMAKKAELEMSGDKLSCIIIDHMQLISSVNNRSDRRNQIGEASRMCKALAKDADCPVIVLSQLSREIKNRASKKPMLTDLRESGDIEQDADVVMLLHRESYYDEDADSRSAEIIIAKNRDGSTGNVYYNWIGEQTRFEERTWDTQKPRSE